jgi:hypothetical protein
MGDQGEVRRGDVCVCVCDKGMGDQRDGRRGDDSNVPEVALFINESDFCY